MISKLRETTTTFMDAVSLERAQVGEAKIGTGLS
jgi:hypothetical protein